MSEKPVLYIVATPIGNLGDITLRAIEIIKKVELIACEDTRVAKKILNHLGVHKELLSLFEHNEHERAERVLRELKSGKSVAYLTDAGTPLISDPGAYLVRRAKEEGINVIPVPGPSAITCALQVCGFSVDKFLFVGFLPRKGKERKEAISKICGFLGAVVIFESPKRILQTLDDLIAALGADTRAFFAREMTKLHEEYLLGSLGDIKSQLATRSEIKGEITFVVFVEKKLEEGIDRLSLRERADKLFRCGLSIKEAVCVLSGELNLPRSEVYKEILKVYKAKRG